MSWSNDKSARSWVLSTISSPTGISWVIFCRLRKAAAPSASWGARFPILLSVSGDQGTDRLKLRKLFRTARAFHHGPSTMLWALCKSKMGGRIPKSLYTAFACLGTPFLRHELIGLPYSSVIPVRNITPLQETCGLDNSGNANAKLGHELTRGLVARCETSRTYRCKGLNDDPARLTPTQHR